MQTPLHYAAKNDACFSLKALIKAECDYKNVRDYKGRTPIHLAAELGEAKTSCKSLEIMLKTFVQLLDRSETAKLLLELPDPASARVEDNQGQTAIVWMIAKMPPVVGVSSRPIKMIL